jgi:hypothetical protein
MSLDAARGTCAGACQWEWAESVFLSNRQERKSMAEGVGADFDEGPDSWRLMGTLWRRPSKLIVID